MIEIAFLNTTETFADEATARWVLRRLKIRLSEVIRNGSNWTTARFYDRSIFEKKDKYLDPDARMRRAGWGR